MAETERADAHDVDGWRSIRRADMIGHVEEEVGRARRPAFPAVGARVVRVEPIDRHQPILVGALLFLAVGVALRVFGLPPIDLHSPLHRLGVMDPFCGGTRALVALSRGDVGTSWRFNPLVPALAVGVPMVVLRWVAGRATGRWVNVHVRRRRTAVALVALATAALWANQQLHADLLADAGGVAWHLLGAAP